jgi:hypothetical protein
MKKLIKLLLVVIVASVIAAAVASAISKKKLSGMSDEEIRDFLASKIGTKVGDDQLASIQDAVIAGVRRGVAAQKAAENDAADVSDAESDVSDVASNVQDESAAAAGEAAAAVIDAAAAVVDEAKS